MLCALNGILLRQPTEKNDGTNYWAFETVSFVKFKLHQTSARAILVIVDTPGSAPS